MTGDVIYFLISFLTSERITIMKRPGTNKAETPDTEEKKQAQVENMVREAESEVSVNAPRDVEGAQ